MKDIFQLPYEAKAFLQRIKFRKNRKLTIKICSKCYKIYFYYEKLVLCVINLVLIYVT